MFIVLIDKAIAHIARELLSLRPGDKIHHYRRVQAFPNEPHYAHTKVLDNVIHGAG